MQDTYDRAAGSFKRTQQKTRRIEPGFGGKEFDEDEMAEDFTNSFSDDPELNAELLEEMRPIPVVPRPAVKPVASAPSFSDTKVEPPLKVKAPVASRSKPKSSHQQSPAPWASVVSSRPMFVLQKPVLSKKDQGELFREESFKVASVVHEEPQEVYTGPHEVIIINVMARSGLHFTGADLLPVLLKQGLRLGSMNIFHRHAEVDGSGPVMFSMANMVKPGTFNLAGMDTFTTPGISLFLQLPNSLGNKESFEIMLAAAASIKVALDGEFKDENRSVFTRQTVEHCRQRIQDFELAVLKHK